MSGRKSVSGGHVKALLFWEVRPQLGSHSLGRLRGTAQHQKKDVLFIIEDWNAKVGSQEIPGVTGKFGLGVQNEAGQRITEFCKENTLVIAKIHIQQHKKQCHTWTSQGQY